MCPRVHEEDELERLMAEAFEARRERALTTASVRRVGVDPTAALASQLDEDSEEIPSAVGEPGRYRILGELARGGIGVVLVAEDQRMGRRVAIKLPLRRRARERLAVRRFLDEARVTSQLQHPGVIPVYDSGQASDGRPFFTMRVVDGRTLADLLGDRSAPGSEPVHLLGIVEQVARAVAYAHERGVVHRDLKPANVLVGRLGEVQVADWGLSKLFAEEEPPTPPQAAVEQRPGAAVGHEGSARAPSLQSSVTGTPGYLAPEQARGESGSIDVRTDVFALGAMLLEVLTGAPPFADGDSRERVRAAAAGELEPALERLARAEVDVELETLVRRCLAPDPAERPADAGAVADRLAAWSVTVDERARAAELAVAVATARAEEAGRRARAERRARRLAIGLAATVVLGTVAATWWRAEVDARNAKNQEVARSAIEGALHEAEGARQRANVEHPGSLAEWRGARAAAESAVRHTAAVDVPPDLRAEAEQLLRTVSVEQEEAVRQDAERRAEAALADELVEIYVSWWSPFRTLSSEALERRIAAAFERHGLGLDELDTDELADRLRTSQRRDVLVGGLLKYTIARTARRGAGDERSVDLAAVVESVSEDVPLRRLAGYLRAGELHGFEELVPGAAGEPLTSEVLQAIALGTWQTASDAKRDQLLASGVRMHPGDFVLRTAWGAQLYRMLRSEEAVQQLTAAHALRPENSEARFLLAAALVHVGRAEEAGRHLGELIDGGFELPHLFVLQAQIRMGRGEVDAAIAAYLRAIELDDAYSQAHLGLALALAESGDREGALEESERAAELDPWDPQAPSVLGNLLLLEDRYDEALEALERSVELGSLHAETFRFLGKAWSAVGDREEAVRCLRRAVELHPEDPAAHGELGVAYWELERFDEAARALRQAVRLRPGDALQHNRLGAVLGESGDLEGAIAAFEEVRRRVPADPGAAANLGLVLTWAGEDQRALQHLEDAARLDPTNPDFGSLLVETLALSSNEAVRDPTRASELAEAFLERHPDSGGGWATLAIACLGAGDPEGSLAAFERAAAKGLELDARRLAYRAMAAFDSGEPQDAVELLEAARSRAAEEGDRSADRVVERAAEHISAGPP